MHKFYRNARISILCCEKSLLSQIARKSPKKLLETGHNNVKTTLKT